MASSASLNPFNFSPVYKSSSSSHVFARDHSTLPRIQRIVVQNNTVATENVPGGGAATMVLTNVEPTLSTLPSSYRSGNLVRLPHAGEWEIRIECRGVAGANPGDVAHLSWGIQKGGTGPILPITGPISITNPANSNITASGSVYLPGGQQWSIVCLNDGPEAYTVDYVLGGILFTTVFTYRGE